MDAAPGETSLPESLARGETSLPGRLAWSQEVKMVANSAWSQEEIEYNAACQEPGDIGENAANWTHC